MRDPYQTLGVKRDAGADEIKAAWRTMAKSVHPDHNQQDPTANERFAEIGRAYETLKDPKKRSRFDQISKMAEAKGGGEQTIMQQRQAAREAAERAKVARANAEKVLAEMERANALKAAAAAAAAANEAAANRAKAPQANAGPQANSGHQAGAQAPGATQSAKSETAEDVVERIFGAKVGAAAAQEAAATAAAATAKRQDGMRADTAEAAEEIVEHQPALAVGGLGSIIGLPPLAMLSSLVRRITGAAPTLEKAPDIAAEATVTVDDIVKGQWITVPLADGREVRFQAAPGIGDGQVVRLKAQGLKLQGMQRGDVAVTVHVTPEERFTIKGLDVHVVLPVTIENAVLGSSATVEGPNGRVTVAIPAWSGSDHLIRVAGQGLSDGTGNKGDLVVELRLMLWEKPDDKITDLMRSMKNGLFL